MAQHDFENVRAKAAAIRLLVLDVDGVLTDGRLQFDADGREQKVFHAQDGYGIRRLIEAGIEVAVISGRKSLAVKSRLAELRLVHTYLGVDEKLSSLQKIMNTMELSPESVAYVGDDIPDQECMQYVGLAIAVANAHPAVVVIADWQTELGGGQGAVREVCDRLLSIDRTGDD